MCWDVQAQWVVSVGECGWVRAASFGVAGGEGEDVEGVCAGVLTGGEGEGGGGGDEGGGGEVEGGGVGGEDGEVGGHF